MKVETLKRILADMPDNARIFQPLTGCSGVLLVTVDGMLIKAVDVSESGYDNKPHKQKPSKQPCPIINQRTAPEFFMQTPKKNN